MHSARYRNIFLHMTNRFGVLLHPDDVCWAAAEGVSEDVIAAVLLLHERRVDEIVPSLSAAELEQVIVLVGRNPRLYPPGTLDALKSKRAASLTPTAGSLLPNVKEEAAAHPHRRPLARQEARQGAPERPKRLNAPPNPTGFRGPPAREKKGFDLVGSELTPAAARIIVEEDLVPVFLGS
jgi:hypothetical protein